MAVNSQKSQQEKSRLKILISRWNGAKEIDGGKSDIQQVKILVIMGFFEI